ncbi:NAD(P)-binding protein, partial [Aureobasidium melanogenum]
MNQIPEILYGKTGQKTWCIVGASRGIGLEFVRQLIAREDRIFATVRDTAAVHASGLWAQAGGDHGRCQMLICDVLSEQSINNFVAQLAAVPDLKLDYVVINAGVLRYPNRATEFSFDEFAFHLHTNTIGPIITAQRLLQTMIPIGTIVFMSSDSGSTQRFLEMEDGFAAYSASKAALNQAMRHMAAELKRKDDDTILLAIHPGEVATDMANIDLGWEVDGIMTPQESVSAMIKVIESKGIQHSGTFWTWENKQYPCLDPTYHDFTQPYLYPSIPTRTRSRAPTKSRDHSRAPRQWPPLPYVEDEEDSLRREYKPEPIHNDHIPSRGTIGQEPLLIDVPDHIPDRRYVWVPSARDSSIAQSTPSSDDERARRRQKRKGPRIETAGLPEMRREASPYAWTKPTSSSHTPMPSEDLFLSPEALTPSTASKSTTFDKLPPTSIPRSDWSDSKTSSRQTPTRDGTPPPRSTSQHVYEGRSTAEAARSAEDHIPQRSSNRYSWTKPDQSHSSPTTPLNPPSVDSSRRRSGPIEGYPLPTDFSRKPAPPQVVNLQQSGRPTQHPRHSSEGSSNSHDTYAPTRNLSSDKLRDSFPPSLPNSRPTSRGGSTQSSPQPSPRIVHHPEYPWNMGSVASTTARRAQPPSRLAESTVPKTPRPQASRSVSTPYSPLPYPDDDRPFETMPSERDHQYFPAQSSTLLPPFSEPVTRVNTPKQPTQPTKARPVKERSAVSGASRREASKSEDQSSSTRKSQMERLPACKRVTYKLKYDDWYTLDGYPGFSICPRCFKFAFDRTQLGTAFKLVPNNAPRMARRCEFSNPWIRLAWVLTANNRHNTLSVMTTIFKADEIEEPCPGNARGWCNWYSIRDRDGHFLRDFIVCPSDVKRLETLFPWFRGLLVPLPMRHSYDEDEEVFGRFCSLRTDHNNRFAAYIDCLFQLHEDAVSGQRLPSTHEFVSLVRHKTRLPECIRDDKLQGIEWYYIPSLAPALTVCEECYHDVVLPWMRSNSEIAMRFNRTKQPVRNEGRGGVSCQLYSRRMRDVFRYAVDTNDMKYLARKAKDRKDVEEDFQQRCRDLQREAERLKGRSGYAISSRAEQQLDHLQREIEAIGETWEMEWE